MRVHAGCSPWISERSPARDAPVRRHQQAAGKAVSQGGLTTDAAALEQAARKGVEKLAAAAG